MANKAYDFNKPLLDGEEKPLKENGKDLMLNETLSAFIMNSSISDQSVVMKFFDWGLELKKTGVLNLDDTDKNALSNFILGNPRLLTLEKGRYIRVLAQ